MAHVVDSGTIVAADSPAPSSIAPCNDDIDAVVEDDIDDFFDLGAATTTTTTTTTIVGTRQEEHDNCYYDDDDDYADGNDDDGSGSKNNKRQKTTNHSNISLMSCTTTSLVPVQQPQQQQQHQYHQPLQHHLSSDAEEFISLFCQKRAPPLMYTTPHSKAYALVVAMARMVAQSPETQFCVVCANNEQAYYTYWFVSQFGGANMSGMLCSFDHVNTLVSSTSNNYNVLIYTYACLSKHLRENEASLSASSVCKLIFCDFDMCVSYRRKPNTESSTPVCSSATSFSTRQYVLDTNKSALFNFATLWQDFLHIVQTCDKHKWWHIDHVFLLNQTISEQQCKQFVAKSVHVKNSLASKRWVNIECVRSPVRNINEVNHHNFYHVHNTEKDEVLVNILNNNPNAVQILIVAKLDHFAHLTRLFETNWIEATCMAPFNFNFEIVNRFSCQAAIRTLVVTPQHANLPFAAAMPNTCIANRLNVIINYDSISTINYVSSCVRFATIQNVYSILSSGSKRDQEIRASVNWRSETIH